MLTLSVRTARGPTSIRIQYSCAQFLLDSSSPARPSLSSFPSVPSLVQHYMGPERKAEEGRVEEEPPSKASQQGIQETTVVLKLKQALYKPQSLPSLQHLTRLIINRQTDCPDQLPLPRPLLRYLQDYPFKVWAGAEEEEKEERRFTESLLTAESQLKGKKPKKTKTLLSGSFVPVKDIAASAVGGQLQKYWTQGDVFGDKMCTNSVNPAVSGFRLKLLRTGCRSTPGKRKTTTTKTCEKHEVLYSVLWWMWKIVHIFSPPSSVQDVYSFLRSTLITLRHLLCHFIFVFSVQHLFVPFTCVHFSIKTTSWTLGVSCFYICIHLLFICVVWNAKRFCCVKACDRHHQPPHDNCSCDTC